MRIGKHRPDSQGGGSARVLATASRLGEAHGLDMLGAMQKPIMVADLEELPERLM